MKQLTIVIEENLHMNIKKRALDQNLSIKDWLLIAIGARQQYERTLGIGDDNT